MKESEESNLYGWNEGSTSEQSGHWLSSALSVLVEWRTGENCTGLSSERAGQKRIGALTLDIITRCGDYSSSYRIVPGCCRRRNALQVYRQRSADPV
jgi:hypothetical protein